MSNVPVDVLAVMDRTHAAFSGPQAAEIYEARAVVAELLEALREDAEKPFSITLDYRNRIDSEPDGSEWWAFKRAEMDAAGYSGGVEMHDGSEVFWRCGYSDRVTAALARCKGGAA